MSIAKRRKKEIKREFNAKMEIFDRIRKSNSLEISNGLFFNEFPRRIRSREGESGPGDCWSI